MTKLHVNEIKRLCDESLRISRRRRRVFKTYRTANRELMAIIVATMLLAATFAIAAALKGWGVW